MKFLIFVIALGLSLPAFAQKVELSDDPQAVEVSDSPSYSEQPTGKKAAQKFFGNSKQSESSSSVSSSSDHYLAVGLGAFVNSTSHKWSFDPEDPGEFTANVTYRFGEWANSMDLMFRLEYQTFDVDANKDPKKFSLMPVIIFPDARSAFPVYFGAGAGIGIFMSQPDDESNLSFDYQLFIGGRMLNIMDSFGLFLETGIKNHVHLLSSGQFDGVFVTFGSVFTF